MSLNIYKVEFVYRKGSDANKGEVLLVEIWKRDRVEFPSWSTYIRPLITVK